MQLKLENNQISENRNNEECPPSEYVPPPEDGGTAETGPLQLKPYDYKNGIPDNDGNIVERIYAKFIGYVIYRTKNVIRVDILDGHQDAKLNTDRHYKIGFPLARLYSLLPENLDRTEPINRLIGRAMTLNIGGEHQEALVVLGHAESRLIKLRTIEGRLQYTGSAFGMVALLGTIYGIVISFRLCGHVLDTQLLEIMIFGALGGLLSITVGYGSLKIDVDANKITNCLIGASRIVIAIIASIFICFAIKANLILSFLNERADDYGLLTFAMVAGFVEMLVPKIMNNLGKDARVSSEGSAEKAKEQDAEPVQSHKAESQQTVSPQK